MPLPHRIRLQSAWDVVAGGVAWTRSFGQPTNVGPADRVWLVIERPTACGVVFNGRPLPPIAAGRDSWRHDVTGQLRDRNELRLDVPAPPRAIPASVRVPLPEAVGLVALEIEAHDQG